MAKSFAQEEPLPAWREEEAEPIDQDAEELQESLRDVAKALRLKRWNTSEEPFRGFGSPPGKF